MYTMPMPISLFTSVVKLTDITQLTIFLNDTEIYLDAHHPDHDNSANSHKFTNKVVEMATQAIQFLICIEKILIHHHPQLCV